MVNLLTYRILADRKKLTHAAVRFFCALLAHYDLRRFRAVDLRMSLEMFGCERQIAVRHLKNLVRAGLLEAGPLKVRTPLYRLAGQCRMSEEELELWKQDTAEYRERLEIAPLPADPLDVPLWLGELRRPLRQ